MEIDLIKQLKDLLEIFNIDVKIYDGYADDFLEFDGGLRKELYENFDFEVKFEEIKSVLSDNKLYFTTDEFGVSYTVFNIPVNINKSQNSQLAMIGPYYFSSYSKKIKDIIERNDLPIYSVEKLENYYKTIPFLETSSNVESLIIMQVSYIFGGKDNFEVRILRESDYIKNPELNLRIEINDNKYIGMVEERYKIEDELIKAIEKGNHVESMIWNGKLGNHRMPSRYEDRFRDYKNYMIVLNTLFRKAVQKAEVHPAHIHELSNMFAKQIEMSVNEKELTAISKQMHRKYCLLVRNRSLKGFSPLIQKVINYVDFHLQEPFSLKTISDEISVNSSYLSYQFKKEMGQTLTDYINQKRIENALVLLVTTDLKINKISEKIGIYDVNYFSKIFKRSQNMTPSEYRNMINGK